MANPEAASYPSAVVTDQEITPWTDRFSTTLAAAIDADDTTVVVTDTAPGGDTLNEPCIITIDNEQIKINSRSGNSLTVGGRGYAGTTAASHAAGATVRANLTAFMWNRVCAEIKAIETLLGAGGSNITSLGTRKQFNVSGSGNFTVPTGITELRVTLIGGGGGGAGGTTNLGGGGGGAGEVRTVRLTGLTAGGTVTCSYGAAGSAGGINTSGGDGGDTSISGAGITGTITAKGGKGGTNAGAGGNSGAAAAGGSAGAARPGEVGTSGAGGGGWNSANQAAIAGGGMNAQQLLATASANVYRGGGGGGCPYGIPGAVSASDNSGNAAAMTAGAGTGNGAGGSGGCYNGTSSATGSGSAGLAGAIYFEW